MTLGPLVILLSILVVGIQFWRLRGIAEFSIDYARQYCDRNNLQFMSLARQKTRLTAFRGKIDWKISYILEFSSNGEDAYEGELVSFGRNIIQIDLPVYKVN